MDSDVVGAGSAMTRNLSGCIPFTYALNITQSFHVGSTHFTEPAKLSKNVVIKEIAAFLPLSTTALHYVELIKPRIIRVITRPTAYTTLLAKCLQY